MTDPSHFADDGRDGFGDEPRGDRRFGSPIDFYRVLLTLWRGRWFLCAAAVIGLMAGVLTAKFAIRSTYVAGAVLKYEGIERLDGMPEPVRGEVGSLVETVRIPEILREVQSRLDLDLSVGTIGRLVESSHDFNTNMIRIDGAAEGPYEAAELVNTLVDVFLQYHRDLQLERLETAIAGIDTRIEAARAELAENRAAYDAFREEHGVSNLTAEQRHGIESAVSLRTQRDMAEAEIQALEARVAQLRRNLRRTPRMVITSAGATTPEASERARLAVELATARSNLSPEHPRVQALQAQLAALENRHAAGSSARLEATTMGVSADHATNQVALSSALADLESARERLTGLSDLSGRAETRVSDISDLEGQGIALLSHVRVGEALMGELRDQRARLANASREPRSGFIIVAPASAPEFPEKNKAKFLAAAGIPTAIVLFAALLLLGRELRGLRIRTAGEVAYWSRAPVVGTTTWPRDRAAVDALIADLDDFAPEATGDTLVVAGHPAATDSARKFAAYLSSDWGDTTLVGSSSVGDSDPPPAGDAERMHRVDPDSEPPIVTPAPSSSDSVALARRPSVGHALARRESQRVRAWDGDPNDRGLRRSARLADRVLVVVGAGQASVKDLMLTPVRLGRSTGVGFVLVGVEDDLAGLPDRIGPVEDFWRAHRT